MKLPPTDKNCILRSFSISNLRKLENTIPFRHLCAAAY